MSARYSRTLSPTSSVEEEYIYIYMYISLHCHHENDFCIKMGSDESQPYPSLPRSLINHTVSVDVKHNNNKKEESYTSQDQSM